MKMRKHVLDWQVFEEKLEMVNTCICAMKKDVKCAGVLRDCSGKTRHGEGETKQY